MGYGGGYVQDVLTHIINVQWGESDQQGLLAEYDDIENQGDIMHGEPTAYALDSGTTFLGVNMGASGLGYTVLSKGLVCFGKPRDGEECFIAAPGYRYGAPDSDGTLQRGVLGADSALTWKSLQDEEFDAPGPLIALSFAGDAFFAVYQDFLEFKTLVAISYDGLHWTAAEAFSGADTVGGAVAAAKTFDDKGNASYLYAACGEKRQEDTAGEFQNSSINLLWATSSPLSGWSSGSNDGMMEEPGTWYQLIADYACTVAGGPVVETAPDGSSIIRDRLVAAAAAKTKIEDDRIVPPTKYAMRSSAAAVSTTGASWATAKLPGLEATLDQTSWGLAVTFVRTKGGAGYFLMSDHEIISPGFGTPQSNLYRSSDGFDWVRIRASPNWMATLSAIAGNLNTTTIVTI